MGTMTILRSAILFPCHSFICYLLSEHKYGKRTARLIWSCYGLVFSILAGLCVMYPNVYDRYGYFYVVSLAVCAAIFVFTSKGSIWKNIFLQLTYANFFMLLNPILMGILKSPLGEADLLFFTVRLLLYGLAGYILKVHILPVFRRVSSEIQKGWGMLGAVSALYLLLLSVFGLQNSVVDPEKLVFAETNVKYLVLYVMLLAALSISYFVIFCLIHFLSEEHKRSQMKERQKMLENELYAEKEFIVQAKQFRHDVRHHNRILLEFLEHGRVQEAKNYLMEYEALIEESSLREFCEHPAANALLCMTERRCRKKGIIFRAEVRIPENLPLEAPEAGMLFGNLLENAWESCEACVNEKEGKKPEIYIHAKTNSNVLCIEVKNTVKKTVEFVDGVPRSTKENGGIGSNSIRMVLEKHRGMIQYQMEGSYFITQIILPLADL